MNTGDAIDLYYFTNHDNISQLRGTIVKTTDRGATLTDVTDGRTSFFPWTSIQRVKYVEKV